MKTVYDTCIIIDALQNRVPFYPLAQQLILAAAENRIDAVLTAKALMDIHYLMRKFLHSEEAARAEIAKLIELFEIESTTEEDCKEALRSGMSDFEDAAMAAAAGRIGADFIVTRNIKDYTRSPVPAILPGELVNRL
jgi:predicted nucleic acid-binding protein